MIEKLIKRLLENRTTFEVKYDKTGVTIYMKNHVHVDWLKRNGYDVHSFSLGTVVRFDD